MNRIFRFSLLNQDNLTTFNELQRFYKAHEVELH